MSIWEKIAGRFSGATRKPDFTPPPTVAGQEAANRLAANRRIPINIWGDVLLDGSPPQIRRVITGQDAHESLLVFYYLAEILSLQEMVAGIPGAREELIKLPTVKDRFERLRQSTKDPQHHANSEVLQVFVPSAIFIDQMGAENTEFCELGCSFFSSIDKLKICDALTLGSIDFGKMRWAAVDHSEFFLRGSCSFHKPDNPQRFLDYAFWKPSSKHPFHLSRFVASYAVNSTDEFAAWMENFSAFHIIDVLNLEAEDFVTSNNGLRQIFFNFPALMSRLDQAGWDIFINDLAPDFNSGRRCAVIKMFGIRKSLNSKMKIEDRIAAHSDLRDILPMERLSVIDATSRLRALNDRYTTDEWTALAAYKEHFPVWGRPIEPMRTMEDVAKFMRPPAGNLNLTFANGQINFYVRHALNDW